MEQQNKEEAFQIYLTEHQTALIIQGLQNSELQAKLATGLCNLLSQQIINIKKRKF